MSRSVDALWCPESHGGSVSADVQALPPQARITLAALRLVGALALVALLAWAFQTGPPSPTHWLVLSALLTSQVLLQRFPVVYLTGAEVITVYADEAIFILALLALPPPYAALLLVAGYVVDQIWARRVWVKASANIAITTSGTLSAAVLVEFVGGFLPWPLATAALGIVVYTVMSSTLLSTILSSVEGSTPGAVLKRGMPHDLLNASIGLLAGIVALALLNLHPLALLVLVPLLAASRVFALLVGRASRETAVRESVARMTEALAGSSAPESAADRIALCCEEVFTPGRVLVEIGGVHAVREEPRGPGDMPALEETLVSLDGRRLGRIRVEPSRRDGAGFTPAAVPLLRIIAGAASVAAQNVLAVREAYEAQAKLEGWLANAHDAVVIVEPSGRIEYANPAAGKLLGAVPEMPATSVFPAGLPPTGRVKELTVSRPSGTIPIEASTAPLPQGGSLIVARDITERVRGREAEAALTHAERLATIGTLTASVGHEINNALTLIFTRLEVSRLMIENARAKKQVDPEVADRLTASSSSLEKAMGRVQAIASTLRSSSRKPAASSIARLDDAVEEVLTLASPRIKGDLTVEKRLHAPNPIAADAGEVAQVILNLVLNAADAMRPRGTGTLQIETREEAGVGVVEVSDDGPGIPEEAMGRIFETFYTTKPEGTGLGLALSRRIARERGGDVTFTSTPGKGTTFRLEIPLKVPAP